MGTVSIGNVALGDGHIKVIVPLTARGTAGLLAEAAELAGQPADIAEWRIDYFGPVAGGDPEIAEIRAAAAALAKATPLPILATFRTAREGGHPIDDDAYRALLIALAESGSVAAIDLEIARGAAVTGPVLEAAYKAEVPVIGSFHDFEATPGAPAIRAKLEELAASGADILKVAYMPASSADVLTLLDATRQASAELPQPLITVAMGELGTLSRVAGGLVGSSATFARVTGPSAPGQVPASELAPVLRALEKWTAAPPSSAI